jgi:hypothetical protein
MKSPASTFGIQNGRFCPLAILVSEKSKLEKACSDYGVPFRSPGREQ